MRTPSVAGSTFCSLVLVGVAGAHPPGFWLTGNAPDAVVGSVTSLSEAGTVAGGLSLGSDPYTPGFTWTTATGRQDLIGPGLPPGTAVEGMSSNGGVLVGYLLDGQQAAHPYRRVGTGTVQDLGLLSGATGSFAWGVSGNGSVVVGGADYSTLTNGPGQAFRWTQDGGMQGLGYLRQNGIRSTAMGISRDGSTIVGLSQSGDPFSPAEAFLWTASTGMQSLPNLPGSSVPQSRANAVNMDGSVIVGEAAVDANWRGTRWTSAGVQDLGSLDGYSGSSYALAVSDDGNVVGGWSGIAFVWTPSRGMVALADYLSAHGVTVPPGCVLDYVTAISGDGLTFGGEARNPLTGSRGGFVARIPSPASAIVLLAPLFCSRRRLA